MIFTTTKKKLEDKELYPDTPVITQDGNVFSLNKKAMEVLGYELNKANVNFITNGFDEDNNLVVANLKLDGMYTNNITAKNTFSSTKFAERLKSQFNGQAVNYELAQFEADGVIYAHINLLAHNFTAGITESTEVDVVEEVQETPVTIDDVFMVDDDEVIETHEKQGLTLVDATGDAFEEAPVYSDYKEEVSSSNIIPERPRTQAEIIAKKVAEW